MTQRVTRWFVYHCRRADGRVFYVGKGGKDRANDLSPSRRNPYFINIVNKDGRSNITVDLFPCASHAEAVVQECADIQRFRALGICLTNMTDGGDGCTGHKASEKSLAVLRPWQGAFHRLSPQAQANIRHGLAVGRAKSRVWRASPAGLAHLRALGEAGRVRLHQERSMVCIQCDEPFVTRSAKAKTCSRRCLLSYRRANGRVYPVQERVSA